MRCAVVTVKTRKMRRRKMEMVSEMVSRKRAILRRQVCDVLTEGEDDDKVEFDGDDEVMDWLLSLLRISTSFDTISTSSKIFEEVLIWLSSFPSWEGIWPVSSEATVEVFWLRCLRDDISVDSALFWWWGWWRWWCCTCWGKKDAASSVEVRPLGARCDELTQSRMSQILLKFTFK